MNEDADLPADVLEAVQANRKIDAIRLLREQRGLGLKEAKDIVDAHVAANPHATVRRRSREGSGLGRIVVIGIAIAVLYGVYRFLS
jgi:hypothetical protein